MKNNFRRQAKKLSEIANLFDTESNALKISIIKDMVANRIPFTDALKELSTVTTLLSFLIDCSVSADKYPTRRYLAMTVL